MLAPALKTNENAVSLIENSGIQFLDMEFELNPNSQEGGGLKDIFMVPMLDRAGKESHLALLERSPSGELMIPGSGREGRKYSDSDSNLVFCEFADVVKAYDGIWFPVPFFSTNVLDDKCLLSPNGRDIGPLNWVRARIVRIERPHTYHVVFAFDTSLQKDFVTRYFAPSERDRQSGTAFAFAWRNGGSELLTPGENGISWVREWAKSVFEARCCFDEFTGEKKDQDAIDDDEKRLMHEAYYLSMLRILGEKANPGKVKICSLGRSTEPAVETNLVLDVGNSRSCGLIFENDGENKTGLLRFSKLVLRDLNAPEQIYEDPFESRIEFARADFDYDGRSARSGRADAFLWPSLARVGSEAANLANLRSGNEGATGLTSPKRYLWNEKLDTQHDEWSLNPSSYAYTFDQRSKTCRLMKVNRHSQSGIPANPRPVCDCINSSGDALFACDDNKRNMLARYSGKSCMTFLLLEVFLQALVQINSVSYRQSSGNKDRPRRLKSVVLTTPPSMSAYEREIYRGCAYEALGILWKCMGYDTLPVSEIRLPEAPTAEIPIAYPDVIVNWDEAEAAQILYLYNETQCVMGGNARPFLKMLRRPDADGRVGERLKKRGQGGTTLDLFSSRIASVDIGGGTTDLVVTDYYFPKEANEESANVVAREVLREGFKIAGDDIVLQVIQRYILAKLSALFDSKEPGFGEQILSKIFGKGTDSSSQFTSMRRQAAEELLIFPARRIINHLEMLPSLGPVSKAEITGTLGDWLAGTEKCPDGVKLNDDAHVVPERETLAFVNRANGDPDMRRVWSDFDILKDFTLSVDLVELNRRIVRGGFDISRPLSALCALCALYKPDLLILTGRPSRIPAIREYFLQRLGMPSSRIILLSEYSCGQWYPWALKGQRIGDTKTTVAVGAAIACMKSSTRAISNFRFDLKMPFIPNNIRYLGHIDSRNLISKPVCRFATVEERRIANGDETKEEAELIPIDELSRTVRLNDHSSEDDSEENSGYSLFKDRHVLPDCLGFRQFKSSNDETVAENYPGTPLFIVDVINGPEEVTAVRRLASLSFFDERDMDKLLDPENPVLDEQQTRECRSMRSDHDLKIASIENGDDPDFVEYKKQVEEQRSGAASRQALSELEAQKPSGLLSGFKMKGWQDRMEARTRELYDSYKESADRMLDEKKLSLKKAETDRYMTLVRTRLNDWYNQTYEDAKEKFKKVRDANSNQQPFAIDFKVMSAKEPPVYRLKNLWAEIKNSHRNTLGGVPELMSIELSSVQINNSNVRDLVRLQVKTVNQNGEQYWNDTGIVYTSAVAGGL